MLIFMINYVNNKVSLFDNIQTIQRTKAASKKFVRYIKNSIISSYFLYCQ